MTKKKFGLFVVAVIVVALAFPIINLIVGLPEGIPLSAQHGSSEQQAAMAILSRKCVNCHAGQGKLPFYASFPIAKGLIQHDMRHGTEAMNMVKAFAGKTTGEVTLAKLEHAIDNGSMPPHKYRMLHWNGGLSSAERNTVIRWIQKERADNYASPIAKGELRAGVLQPLPQPPTDLDPAKVALGNKLFHDQRLSKDDTLSCASCHDLAKGGTDLAQYSTGVGGQLGGINAPTVYNAALQIAQFWDGRAADLQAQADGPPNNPMEMASNWHEIIGKLEQDEELKTAMKAVYPDGFSDSNITDAIATFEKTLITPNSPFDKHLLGDSSALSDDAKAGQKLFVSSGCATCHVGAGMGGQSYEKMGREADYFADRGNPTDADKGRVAVTNNEADTHKFKVPLLRNVARTSPYFHDGTVKTLEEAVEKMAKYQLGLTLSARQKKQLVDFLDSLTGEYQGEPVR